MRGAWWYVPNLLTCHTYTKQGGGVHGVGYLPHLPPPVQGRAWYAVRYAGIQVYRYAGIQCEWVGGASIKICYGVNA